MSGKVKKTSWLTPFVCGAEMWTKFGICIGKSTVLAILVVVLSWCWIVVVLSGFNRCDPHLSPTLVRVCLNGPFCMERNASKLPTHGMQGVRTEWSWASGPLLSFVVRIATSIRSLAAVSIFDGIMSQSETLPLSRKVLSLGNHSEILPGGVSVLFLHVFAVCRMRWLLHTLLSFA